MREPRLRTRLAIWFAASLLLIMAPCFAGLLYLEWHAMREALDHHLEEDLEMAAEMLVRTETGLRWRTETTRDMGYDAGRRRWVEVYTAQGAPLYFRGLPEQFPAIRDSLPPPPMLPPGRQTVRTPAGAYVRVLTVGRMLDGQQTWLRVARTEDPMRGDFQRLALFFAAGVPLAVLVAALSGYVISGRALSPLTRMAERARTISADRLSERLPVENPDDELGQLSTVFNETFARLEASFAHLKRFSADASHELRTPLTALRSVGEVGLREPMTEDGYREVIGSMLEEADRLARLVDTLLMLSRWESGRIRPQQVRLDLRDIARDVVDHIGILAEERGIALTASLDTSVPVNADAVMIRQAVLNVLDNAIKFTPPGGSVLVAARVVDGEAQVVVDDGGPGIPEAEWPRVLERFYRSSSTGADTPGSGLGLSIVHWAMTANGGRIVFGAHAGGGARVMLVLPSA
jgi:heavy metal sensor kinase